MNAFLRKEVRVLQPSFLIGLLAALAILTLPKHATVDSFWSGLRVALPFVFCPAMVIMLALDSFGREVGTGTFSQLLAQPVSRDRVWRTKTALLVTAILVIWTVWFGCGVVRFQDDLNTTVAEWRQMMEVSLLFALAAFSGGLWTVLLFRQVAVAFWFTLLMPAALLVAVAFSEDKIWEILGTLSPTTFTPNRNPAFGEMLSSAVLILYSLAGFCFARRLFLRAQDTQWSGSVIALPKIKALPSLRFAAGTLRHFRPRRAMLAREFGLHHSQLVIAACLAVLHLAAILARNFRFESIQFSRNGTMDFILRQFWYLWLVMPLLVGCASVAEERKLGTLEGQLCLPARRRTQFAAKLGMVLFFSVLLGAVMPALLERLDGTRILASWAWENHAARSSPFEATQVLMGFFHWLGMIPGLVSFLALATMCSTIGTLSFYFSTLARNTLQALGPALLGICVTMFLLLAGFLPEELTGHELWRGFLPYVIGLPLLALVGLYLAYWNYRHVQPGWPAWLRNVLALVVTLAFVTVASTALYHRVWELASPLEPPHGPARLAKSERATMQNQFGSLAVSLPGGQVWLGNIGFSIPNLRALLLSDWRMKELSGGSRFLEGTNWASVADCIFDTVGIQNDGSLWVSQKPLPREFYRIYFRTNESMLANKFTLERVGDANDWKSAVGLWRNPLLLKRDGTLWSWQTDKLNRTNQWPGLRAFKLEQVGTDSDWAEIYSLSGCPCLRKNDGRVWSNDYHASETNGAITWPGGGQTMRAPFMDQHDWRGAAWVQSSEEVAGGFLVGVRDDGTFRLMANWQSLPGRNAQYRPVPAKEDLQLGTETNWLAAASFGNLGVVTLKADGTLWRWNFPDDPQIHPKSATATRLGKSSDWIAVTGDDIGIRCLATDGSLWFWRAPLRDFRAAADEFGIFPLIDVSRRPQKITNILAEAK